MVTALTPNYHLPTQTPLTNLGRIAGAGLAIGSAGLFAKDVFEKQLEELGYTHAPWYLMGVGAMILTGCACKLFYEIQKVSKPLQPEPSAPLTDTRFTDQLLNDSNPNTLPKSDEDSSSSDESEENLPSALEVKDCRDNKQYGTTPLTHASFADLIIETPPGSDDDIPPCDESEEDHPPPPDMQDAYSPPSPTSTRRSHSPVPVSCSSSSSSTSLPPVTGPERFIKLLLRSVSENAKESFLKRYCTMTEEEALQALDRETTETLNFAEVCKMLNPRQELILICRIDILAAMRGHFRVLEKLIAKGLPADWRDMSDWYLSHYACLMPDARDRLPELEGLGIPVDLPNKWGATALDFAMAVSPQEAHPDITVEVDGRRLSVGDYHQVTGTRYTTGNQWSVDSLLALRTNDYSPVNTPFYDHIAAKFAKYRQEAELGRTNIALRTITEGPLTGQREAVATCDMAPGDIVVEYTGEVVSLNSDPLIYPHYQALGTKNQTLAGGLVISPELSGSMAEFINHGFPNCISLNSYYHGLPVTLVFAARSIKKGEVLYHNYGPDYFSTLHIEEQELNRAGLDAFMKETNNLQRVNSCVATDYSDSNHSMIGSYNNGHLSSIPLVNSPEVFDARLKSKGIDGMLRYLNTRRRLIKSALKEAPRNILRYDSPLMTLWREMKKTPSS